MKKVMFLIAVISINLIISCGNSGKEHYDKGMASLSAEDYTSAIAEFDKAIEIEPNNAEYYYYRGSAKLDNENYKAAKEDFSKALELDYSDKASAYMKLGEAKSYLDDDNGAISDYNKSIEIDPKTNAEVYFLRAISKSKIADDFYDEINDYNKAIEIDPNYTKAYYNRGIVKNNSEDFEGAIHDFDFAIQSGYKIGYYERGYSKYMLEQYQEALLDLDTILSLNLSDYQHMDIYANEKNIYFLKGLIHLELDKLDEACAAFNKAKEFGYSGIEDYLNEYCQ
ncbi:MAG TPA: tetratricopeptide repeat protein [Bacteroidales bacterium]|nr:tetratricopeptide repeat protein [Bacteroidales bacterium]HQB20860.1 tetratricopeptide repeat protein [Bacteroidales bacterium]